MDSLVQSPPYSYYIDPSTLKGSLVHVGFLKREYGGPQSEQPTNRTKLDAEFIRYERSNPWPLPIQKEFGYAGSNFRNLEKAVRLFDQPVELPNFPQREIEQAYNYLEEMFADLKIYSIVKEEEEVDWKLRSSTGALMGRKWKQKLQYLTTISGRTDLDDHWNFAHVLDSTPLWKMSGKGEILPMEKINTDDIRVFEIPPVNFLGNGMRLCQSFNESIHEHWEDTPIAVGTVMQRGGLDTMLRRMDLGGSKFTQDVRKWDKFYRAKIREYCLRLRVACYRRTKTNITPEEYERRLSWFYQKCIYGYLLTPWGQVLHITGGAMFSGDPNTTTDNTIANILIDWAYALFNIQSRGGRVQSWRHLLTIMFPKAYADDKISTTHPKYKFLAEFQRRREFFLRCGFQLKEEDDKVQDTFVGLTFLGATIKQSYGMYVPSYNPDRIRAGLMIKQHGSMTPIERYSSIVSLLLLSTFVDESGALFEWIREFARHMSRIYDKTYGIRWATGSGNSVIEIQDIELDQGDEYLLDFIYRDTRVPFLPDMAFAQNFWTGRECAAPSHQSTRLVITTDFQWYENNCGPGWSDGKYQPSVKEFKTLPKDELDHGCQDHDIGYHFGDHLAYVDFQLAKRALKFGGVKGFLTFLGIGAQGVLRYLGVLDRSYNKPQVKEALENLKPDTVSKLVQYSKERDIPAIKRVLQQQLMPQYRNGRNRPARAGPRRRYAAVRRGRPSHPRGPRSLTHLSARRPRASPRTNAGPRVGGRRLSLMPLAVTTVPRGISGPRQKSATRNTATMVGKEQIGIITVGPGNNPGDILYQMTIAPQAISGTRLQLLATLWERYDPINSSFSFESSCGTATPGQIIMAFDPDPSDVLVSGANMVSRALDNNGKKFAPYESTNLNYRREGKTPTLYTNSGVDPRLSLIGTLYVVSNASWGNLSGTTTLGTINWNYEIKFHKPTTEAGNNSATNTASCTVTTPAPGGIFGASISNDANSDFFFQYQDASHLQMPVVIGGVYWLMIEYVGTGTMTARASLSYSNASILNSLVDSFNATNYFGMFLLKATTTGVITIIQGSGVVGSTAITSVRIMAFRTRTVTLTPPAKSFIELSDKVNKLEALIERLQLEEESSDDEDLTAALELVQVRKRLKKEADFTCK